MGRMAMGKGMLRVATGWEREAGGVGLWQGGKEGQEVGGFHRWITDGKSGWT